MKVKSVKQRIVWHPQNRPLKPEGIVIHAMDEKINGMDAPNFLSSINLSVHGFVYDDGYVLYGQRSNLMAYHAGKSEWNGYNGLNYYFLGVECLIDSDSFITKDDKEVMTEAVSDITHHTKWKGSQLEKLVYVMNYKDWLMASQMDALVDMVHKWKDRYGIDQKNIVGHDAVSPGRKFDPGIEFPWGLFFKKLNLK